MSSFWTPPEPDNSVGSGSSIGGGNVNDGTGLVDTGVPIADSSTFNVVDLASIDDVADQTLSTWIDSGSPKPYTDGDQTPYADLRAGKTFS